MAVLSDSITAESAAVYEPDCYRSREFGSLEIGSHHFEYHGNGKHPPCCRDLWAAVSPARHVGR
jgi:hypothetical protein